MKRYLKKIAIGFVLFIFLLAIGGWCISYFFQNEVIHFVIDRINQQVDSRIQVQSAHFSVFRKFPNVSVEFRNVVMSPVSKFDTLSFDASYSRQLLSGEKVFVELNLLRLLKKDFRITKIEVQNGTIHLLTDKYNQHNFTFWKTQTTSESNESTPIELQNVTLRNVDVYYSHQRSKTIIAIHADKTRLNGKFSSRQYSLGVDWDGTVQHFSVDGSLFIQNKTIDLTGKLDVDDNTFTIRKSNLSLAKMALIVSGGFSTGDNVNLDLHFEGNHLDYASMVSMAPDKYSDQLHNYPGKGVVNFSAHVTGLAGNDYQPRVDVTFGIKRGEITHRHTKMQLSDLSFDGSFTTGEKNQITTSVLHVKNVVCNIGGSSLIKGNMSIRNFKTPVITYNIEGNVDIGHLYQFFPVQQLASAGGMANGQLSAAMRLKNLTPQNAHDIEQLNIQGSLTFQEASINLNDRPYQFGHMNGTLYIDNSVNTKDLSFVLNSSDFSVNGRVERLIPYILNRSKTLYFDATVASQRLCIDSLLVSKPTNSIQNDKSANESSFLLPDNIVFDVDLNAKTLRYQNVETSNVKAKLTYKPRVLAMHSVQFAAMSGNVSGNGTLTNDASNNIQLLGQTTIRQLNIRQMFQTFHNFSQNVVRAEHLKGALSGDIDFAIGWDNDMRLRMDKITVESNLELKGGELTGFEPMNNLSRFVALEELQHVKFSTLQTQVFVKNQQITFPTTNIESSAFNISGSGTHNFDNRYTYYVKVLLSELLAAKARKAKRENSENEYVEKDGKRTSIYLKVIGQGEQFNISYDKQSAKASVVSDINKEKQTLKSILKEEFGWFKNDTTASPVTPANHNEKLRFTFDDQPQQETTTPDKTTKKPKRNQQNDGEEKIRIEW